MANEFYESIKRGLEQVLAYEKGDKSVAKSQIITVKELPSYKGKQIKAIRENLGLTQLSFAHIIGVSQKTVEAWEASRNTPQGPAQRFLSLMDTGGINFLNQYNLIS